MNEYDECNECNVCYERYDSYQNSQLPSVLMYCERDNCNFMMCQTCITNWRRPNCPQCENVNNEFYQFLPRGALISNVSSGISLTPEDQANLELSNRLFGTQDRKGCCVIISEPDRWRCTIFDCIDGENSYSFCCENMFLVAHICITGNIITNLIETGKFMVGRISPRHGPNSACSAFCFGGIYTAILSVCCYYTDKVLRKGYVVSPNAYYAATLIPPSFCYIERLEASSRVIPEN